MTFEFVGGRGILPVHSPAPVIPANAGTQEYNGRRPKSSPRMGSGSPLRSGRNDGSHVRPSIPWCALRTLRDSSRSNPGFANPPPGLPRWFIGLATNRCHRVAQSDLPGLSAAGGAERLGRVVGEAGSPRPVVVFKPINHRHRVGGDKTPSGTVRPTHPPPRSCIHTMVRAAQPTSLQQIEFRLRQETKNKV